MEKCNGHLLLEAISDSRLDHKAENTQTTTVPGDGHEYLVGAHGDAAHVRDDHGDYLEHPELHPQHQAPVKQKIRTNVTSIIRIYRSNT